MLLDRASQGGARARVVHRPAHGRRDLPALAETIARLPGAGRDRPHGAHRPAKGLAQPPFVVLLELARLGHVWVKLTGADRITRAGPPYLGCAAVCAGAHGMRRPTG
jgi:hypothetical protein